MKDGKRKRGQKPNEEMFTIQVDNLEIMMIDHLIQSSEEEDTTEKRNKRRNKIAALESRI